jgi:arabinose-5-phosphate isomerase
MSSTRSSRPPGAAFEDYRPEALVGRSASEVAAAVVRLEAAAVLDLASRVGPMFDQAVELLAGLRGQLIVSGVGKSGLVAQRIAATLTATTTPATFLHPSDALHGDLGILRPEDAALLISKSGDTDELLRLVPLLRERRVPILLITASADSPLGRLADLVLEHGRPREACPHGLAPTTSLTVAGVLGDALAVALILRHGRSLGDLAVLHPGGAIGRAAGMQARDAMRAGEAMPRVALDATLREALSEIVTKRVGMTTVLGEDGVLAGVLTDGDLKRILLRHADPLDLRVQTLMNPRPRTIASDLPLPEAVRVMEDNEPGPITSLVVVDPEGRPIGVLHLHDCLRPPRS